MTIENANSKLNEFLKELEESNMFLDKKEMAVKEDKEVYVLVANGTFKERYIGDGDWVENSVDSKIILEDNIGEELYNNIDFEDGTTLEQHEMILESLNKLEHEVEGYVNIEDEYEDNPKRDEDGSVIIIEKYSDESDEYQWDDLVVYITKKRLSDI